MHEDKIFIGDIRDKDRLARAMNNVEYIHAAAMKHEMRVNIIYGSNKN